jgi:TerY-C metal binding domain
MVAVSFGNEADTHLLGELTEHVLHFNNTNAAAYKAFFKWVTDSIKTSSESVENNGSGFGLAGLNGDISKIDVTKPQMPRSFVDDNYVVLAAKCQNTKRPYLIKYRKTIAPSEFGGYNTMSYRLVGGFQVDNSYFDLSDEASQSRQINTDELIGAPSCPCCGNQYSFAMCGCGNLHCIGGEEYSTCPWCGNQGKYTFDGDNGFDVTRTRG